MTSTDVQRAAAAPNAGKKVYESLGPRYRDQNRSTIFGFFPYRDDQGETWETPFERLASKAKKGEEWNFRRPEFRRPNVHLPILHNYLNYTFLRLQEQDKIAFTADGEGACFNTGLLTPDEKELFAVFARHQRAGGDGEFCDWLFKGFHDSYAQALAPYRSALPEVATYFEDASDLVFDVGYDIDINIGHILDEPENQERLPPELRGNRTLALNTIEGATRFLKKRIIRNYKTAIPQWYAPAKRIQLLLPLSLTAPDRADLALVAEKDTAARLYRVRTALRMDMAYSNARLLTRPDREWLDP